MNKSLYDVYKTLYTEKTPYLKDLDGDTHFDRVYYNPELEKFEISFFNEETFGYDYWGTVEDYYNEQQPNYEDLEKFLLK